MTVMAIVRIKFHNLKVIVVLMATISLSGVSVMAMISFRRMKMVAIQNGQGLLLRMLEHMVKKNLQLTLI